MSSEMNQKKIKTFAGKMELLENFTKYKIETGANFTEEDQKKYHAMMSDAVADLITPEDIKNHKAKDFENSQLDEVAEEIKKKIHFLIVRDKGHNSNYCFEIGKRKFRENFESKLLGRLKADGLIIEIQGEGEEKVWNISWTS